MAAASVIFSQRLGLTYNGGILPVAIIDIRASYKEKALSSLLVSKGCNVQSEFKEYPGTIIALFAD